MGSRMAPVVLYSYRPRPGVVVDTPQSLERKVRTGLHWDKLEATLNEEGGKPKREARMRATPTPAQLVYRTTEGELAQQLISYETVKAAGGRQSEGGYDAAAFRALPRELRVEVGGGGEVLTALLAKKTEEEVERNLTVFRDDATGDLYVYHLEAVRLKVFT
jgi:hypothetical protein